jgi:hypothetical protein
LGKIFPFCEQRQSRPQVLNVDGRDNARIYFYLQPRSRKITSKTGMGIPNSHSKM